MSKPKTSVKKTHKTLKPKTKSAWHPGAGKPEVRRRAEEALLDMVPEKLFACGLTCDFGMECINFLRQHFDIDNPDPASTGKALMSFGQRMRRLFCDGLILGKASQENSDEARARRTMTQIVYEEIDFPQPSLSCEFIWGVAIA